MSLGRTAQVNNIYTNFAEYFITITFDYLTFQDKSQKLLLQNSLLEQTKKVSSMWGTNPIQVVFEEFNKEMVLYTNNSTSSVKNRLQLLKKFITDIHEKADVEKARRDFIFLLIQRAHNLSPDVSKMMATFDEAMKSAIWEIMKVEIAHKAATLMTNIQQIEAKSKNKSSTTNEDIFINILSNNIAIDIAKGLIPPPPPPPPATSVVRQKVETTKTTEVVSTRLTDLVKGAADKNEANQSSSDNENGIKKKLSSIPTIKNAALAETIRKNKALQAEKDKLNQTESSSLTALKTLVGGDGSELQAKLDKMKEHINGTVLDASDDEWRIDRSSDESPSDGINVIQLEEKIPEVEMAVVEETVSISLKI